MSSILREREREEWKWNGQQKREVIENHIKMNLYKMMDKTLDHVKMNVYIHSKERELNVYKMRDNRVDNTFNMEDYITYERLAWNPK